MKKMIFKLLFGSAIVGAIAGYAVTRWGLTGAAASVTFALITGFLSRKLRLF